MPSERPDGDQVEHFLVDGVAPPVIGGGPPESPFDLEPDPEPEPRGRAHGSVATELAQRGPVKGPAERYYYEQRSEPPTAPIPVLRPPDQEQKRRSWVSRVFRLPGN